MPASRCLPAARALAVLLAVGAPPAHPGQAPAAPAASEAAPAAAGRVAGTYRSHRPAGPDRELFLTLRLLPDGTAELDTAEREEGPSFPEKGAWRQRGAEIAVLVFEEGRPPDPNELLLEARGDALVPLRWNPEFYGKSPPGAFLRQP